MQPSARLLRLLTLMQSRPQWSGADLCDRLGVSARTLRYDVAKLRDLGYAVGAEPGAGGGYRLQPGGTLPPLPLGDDEAVALAVGLRAATGVPGLAEPAATALVKLEQVLPWRLRGRVNAVRSYSDTAGESGPRTDPEAFAFLAAACRDQRRVRLDYTAADGTTSRKEVEPYRLVQLERRWYVQAYDPERQDWRSLRLDRMVVRRPEGARFVAREVPPASTLRGRVDAYYAQHWAVVLVAGTADSVTRRLPAQVPVEAAGADRCRVHATGESPHALALNVLMLDAPFVVEDASPGVVDALDTVGARIAAARVGRITRGARPGR